LRDFGEAAYFLGAEKGAWGAAENANEARINFQTVALGEEEFGADSKGAEWRYCRFVNLKHIFGYAVWPEESR
jgi:hypothetical protein